MEIIPKASFATLSNSGVRSEQLLFPENSASRRLTITFTRVTMQALSAHYTGMPTSEQICVALQGRGT
jgi:hypothetical protein